MNRSTTTPLRRRRGRPPIILLAIPLVFVLAAVIAFQGSPEESREDLAAELDAQPGIGALLNEGTAQPTPCPYCNQNAAAYRSQTAVEPPEILGTAAALVEGGCGSLLYGKQQDERLPPASLTKIATALVAIDRLPLDRRIDVRTNGWELSADDDSSIMGLEAGMNLSVEELLYGLLLPSGNDAAIELSENMGGQAATVSRMNQLVSSLGLRNTHFVNTDGRHADGHYSSAFDMAVLGEALMDRPVLRHMVGQVSYMPAWNGPLLWNRNYMLQFYEGTTGVKTGYTEEAKATLVGSVLRDGRELFVSILGSDDVYTDAWLLLNWAFANTQTTCNT